MSTMALVKSNNIKVVGIKDPFNHNSREVKEIAFIPGKPLGYFIEQLLQCKIGGTDLIINVNGKNVEDLDSLIPPGSLISFCIVPEGDGDDGGKGVLRIISMIAVTAISFGLAGPIAGGLGFTGAGIGAKIATGLIFGGLATAGAFLVNAALPVTFSSTQNKLTSPDWDTSRNYGWGAKSNALNQGAILPSLIGSMRVAPPLIHWRRWSSNNDFTHQYLDLVVAICEDEIENLTSSDIWINNKLISAYTNVIWDFTNGEEDNTKEIDWIDSSLTEQGFSSITLDNYTNSSEENLTSVTGEISTGGYLPVGYITTGLVQEFTLSVYFPDGLYYISDGKVYIHNDFTFKIRYRAQGSGTWIYKDWGITVPPIAYGTYAPSTHQFTVEGLSSDNYEIQWLGVNGVSGASYDSTDSAYVEQVSGLDTTISESGKVVTTTGDDVTVVSVGISLPGGIYYIGDDGEFEEHSVEVVGTIRAQGESDWERTKKIQFSDATSSALRASITWNDLDPDQYEVMCYVKGQESSSRYMDTVSIDYLQEGKNSEFTYRGVAILAIRLLASENISGSIPTIEVKPTRSDYYTGRSPTNPAWSAYYRLIRHNIDSSNINFTSFSHWADYCDTEGFTCNLYIDAQLTLQEVLSQLGAAGRAMVVLRGTTWDVIVDEETEPTQLFTMDNIIAGSFEETFLDQEGRANAVLLTFFNEDDDFNRSHVYVRDPNISEASEIKRVEVPYYAITNEDHATKMAIYLLNKTRLTNRTVSWMADIDALACQVGDVVYFQHDVPAWGFVAGRVVSATSATVVLDTAVDYDDPENSSRTFKIFLRHQTPSGSTDDIEVFEVINPYPNTGVTEYTLADSETWESTPAEGALATIGWVTGTGDSGEVLNSVKKFRVERIERYQDCTFKLTCTEYYEDAFLDTYVVSLPEIESGLDEVALLSGTPSWLVSGETRYNYISLSWVGSATTFYIFYSIYNSDTSEYGPWNYVGETDKTFYDIHNLKSGFTYKFAVSPSKTDPTLGDTVVVSFTLSDTYPADYVPDVTNLQVIGGGFEFEGDSIYVEWDDVDWWSFEKYKVEVYDNGTSTLKRTEYVVQSKFVYTYSMNLIDFSGSTEDNIKFIVYTVDTYGRESDGVELVVSRGTVGDVSNLVYIGGGTSFDTKDLEVVWDAHSLIPSEFLYYKVEIRHSGVLKRTEYVTVEYYNYTYEMNKYDGGGTPSASVNVTVYVVDVYGNISSGQTQTFTNENPNPITSLVSGDFIHGVYFSWVKSPSSDFDHYSVRVQVESEGWSDWFDLYDNYFYYSLSDTQSESYPSGATIYLEVIAVDTFGNESTVESIDDDTDSLYVPPSSIDDFSKISQAFPLIPVVVGATFTNNSPGSGQVSWNEHSLWYNGTEYTIASGNTSASSGDDAIYIWWNNGDSAYTTTAAGTHPSSSMGTDDFIIAVNVNGSHTLAWNSIANQVIGSAYIQKASITDLHVSEISANKITAGTILTPGVYIGSAYYSGGTSLDSLKPAQANATNGASWTSNLSNIPVRFGDSASVAGLYVTSSYLGYYNGSSWNTYIDSSGNFYFAGNANNYISWNGSSFNISTNNSINILSGGDINIQNGGDINLIAAAGNSGEINLYTNTSTLQATIYADASVNIFHIKGQNSNSVGVVHGFGALQFSTAVSGMDFTAAGGTFSFDGASIDCSQHIILSGSNKYLYAPHGLFGGASYYSSVSCLIRGQGASSSYKALVVEDSGGYDYFYCRDDREVWCDGGVWYTSDIDKKENVKSIEDVVGGFMYSIDLIRFNRIGSEKTSAGVSAQSLLYKMPEAVDIFEVKEDGEDVVRHAVRDAPQITYIWKWNKEQQDMIDAVGTSIQDMQKDIYALQKEIELLKS